jgi:RND family efflux transporter MFP subunit
MKGNMKNKIRRLLIWLLVAIFIGFLFWRIWELIRPAAGRSERSGLGNAVAVIIEPVKMESIREIRTFSGSIEAEYSYRIAPKISGRLLQLVKNVGDFVQENEIVALLDDDEYQQALLEAQANLNSAQASLAEAESQLAIANRDLKQAESLHKRNFISDAELDRANAGFISAQAKLELAKSQIQQRETALRLAEIRLSYTILRASKSGYIGQRFSEEGSLLAVNSPVVSIVGIDNVIVRSNIVEKIYARIEKDMLAVIMTDVFPERVFSGKVLRLAPVLNEQSRMAEMEILVKNDSHALKPGMFSKIELVLSQRENVQTVPNGAIIRDNGEHSIFTVDTTDNTARHIPVQIGLTHETRTEIISPIIIQPVIILGQYQVKNGSKVLISNQVDNIEKQD